MYEYVCMYISLVFLCLLGMAVFSLSLIVLNNNTIFKYFKREFQTWDNNKKVSVHKFKLYFILLQYSESSFLVVILLYKYLLFSSTHLFFITFFFLFYTYLFTFLNSLIQHLHHELFPFSSIFTSIICLKWQSNVWFLQQNIIFRLVLFRLSYKMLNMQSFLERCWLLYSLLVLWST